MNPTIIFIYARDESFGIGKDGTLPWRCKADLKRFAELTTGNVIVMGRKTWESLPKKPLPKRTNLVFSTSEKQLEGAEVLTHKEQLEQYYNNEKIFIIGGANLWRLFEADVELVYETIIPGRYDCDVFYQLPTEKFSLISETTYEDHILKIWKRKC